MTSVGVHLVLAVVVAAAVVRPVSVERESPAGTIFVERVFVKKSISDELEGKKVPTPKDFVVMCSTASHAGRAVLKDLKVGKENIFPEPVDARMELLSFEEMECELREALTSDEQQILSHGMCTYSYSRFLMSTDNSVECQLSGGSSFKLQMVCEGGCPEAPVPRNKPYCQGVTTVPPANFGIMNAFGDGSPGFSMYTPNSQCGWRIPRSEKGVTNFLFTRFDLGAGDKVLVYESKDGLSKKLIKTYEEHSTPESIATDAPYMIVEFISDGEEEGLGFYGFYYDTNEKHGPVSIVPVKGIGKRGGESAKEIDPLMEESGPSGPQKPGMKGEPKDKKRGRKSG